MSDEVAEVMDTLQRIRFEFEDLAVGGTRAVGLDRVAALQAMAEEFSRIGASHIAQRLDSLATAIESEDRSAAEHLMRAQSSIRVFERTLTLETAASALQQLVKPNPADEDADGELP
ncbi:MAG: hypothetical protein AB8B91_12085 [Rubripirellula sp.]